MTATKDLQHRQERLKKAERLGKAFDSFFFYCAESLAHKAKEVVKASK